MDEIGINSPLIERPGAKISESLLPLVFAGITHFYSVKTHERSTAMIEKKWVMESGEGHWVVTCGDTQISCDPGELSEVMAELAATVSSVQ